MSRPAKPSGSGRVSAAFAVQRAKARYLRACEGGPDGRELPLVELATRYLAWMRAICAEMDEAAARYERRLAAN